MNSTEKKSLPKPLLWAILVVFALSLCLAAAEIVVRVVPGSWSSSFFYIFDPVIGTWHFSDFTGDNINTDYTIRDIHMNQFGMRDKDRSVERSSGVNERIAFLGDSFVEGMQVADNEVVTRQMEGLMNQTEVLNFGVAGFGTVQELLAYEGRVRPFHPDVVILGLFVGNDMRNNSFELESYNGSAADRPFVKKQNDGSWTVVPVPDKPASQNPLILFLKKHFALYRFLWFEKGRVASLFVRPAPVGDIATSTLMAEKPDVFLARLYAPPTKEPFTSAWEATEYLIQRLDAEVTADGGKFVLVLIPDAAAMERDPRVALEAQYSAELPDTFDPTYPQKRLVGFSRSAGIPCLDLASIFRAYRDEHDLSWPYFSFAHDGHWSALGHQVAAKAIVEYLKTELQ